jgi:hypothetical protein
MKIASIKIILSILNYHWNGGGCEAGAKGRYDIDAGIGVFK